MHGMRYMGASMNRHIRNLKIACGIAAASVLITGCSGVDASGVGTGESGVSDSAPSYANAYVSDVAAQIDAVIDMTTHSVTQRHEVTLPDGRKGTLSASYATDGTLDGWTYTVAHDLTLHADAELPDGWTARVTGLSADVSSVSSDAQRNGCVQDATELGYEDAPDGGMPIPYRYVFHVAAADKSESFLSMWRYGTYGYAGNYSSKDRFGWDDGRRKVRLDEREIEKSCGGVALHATWTIVLSNADGEQMTESFSDTIGIAQRTPYAYNEDYGADASDDGNGNGTDAMNGEGTSAEADDADGSGGTASGDGNGGSASDGDGTATTGDENDDSGSDDANSSNAISQKVMDWLLS